MNVRTPRFLQVSLLTLCCALPCVAQDTPEWEVFTGYSLQRSELREYYKSSPILYSIRNRTESLHGWNLSVTENRNRRIGGTLELNGFYATIGASGVKNQERVHSVLYGPRIFQKMRWGTPFAEILAGVAYAQVKVRPVGPKDKDLSFAMAFGGGVDANIGKRVAVRLFKAEYLHASLLATRQGAFRISSGVVFNLGRKK